MSMRKYPCLLLHLISDIVYPTTSSNQVHEGLIITLMKCGDIPLEISPFSVFELYFGERRWEYKWVAFRVTKCYECTKASRWKLYIDKVNR